MLSRPFIGVYGFLKRMCGDFGNESLSGKVAFIGSCFAVLMWLGTYFGFINVSSDAQKAFDDYQIHAKLVDGKLNLVLPKNFDGVPHSVVVVVDFNGADSKHRNYQTKRVRIYFPDGDEQNGSTVLIAPNFKNFICSQISTSANCENVDIRTLRLEAEFARGPKSDILSLQEFNL